MTTLEDALILSPGHHLTDCFRSRNTEPIEESFIQVSHLQDLCELEMKFLKST